MINPLQKWLNKLLFSHVFYFAGISATTAAAVAAGAAGVAGAAMSAGASGDAANMQAQSARDANAANLKINQDQLAYLRESRDQANAMQRPFANIGLNAQNRLSYLLGLSPTQYGFVDKPSGSTDANSGYYTFGMFKTDRNNQINSVTQQIQALKAQKVKGAKAIAQRNNQLKKLQQQRAQYQKQITQGGTGAAFTAWQQKQAQAASNAPNFSATDAPIDSTYGALMQDAPEFNFQADPGYQFRLEQGNRALDNKLAAMGMSGSGAAVKEAVRFNQGEADQTYKDAWGRYLDSTNVFNTNRQYKYNALAGLGGSGQQAASNIAANNQQFGQSAVNALGNYGQNQSNNILAAGQAGAAGRLGQANAWGNGLNSIAQIAGDYMGRNSGGYDPSAGGTGAFNNWGSMGSMGMGRWKT